MRVWRVSEKLHWRRRRERSRSTAAAGLPHTCACGKAYLCAVRCNLRVVCVAVLYLVQEPDEPVLIEVELLDEAHPFKKIEGQARQRAAGGHALELKAVKLPLVHPLQQAGQLREVSGAGMGVGVM